MSFEDEGHSQRDFPGDPVVKTCLAMQGVWIHSLVWELRSPVPCGQKNQNVKQKQYCNKFNKELKENNGFSDDSHSHLKELTAWEEKIAK